MKYINQKTGAVLYSLCHLSGGDWVLATENPKPHAEEGTPPKKPSKKKE